MRATMVTASEACYFTETIYHLKDDFDEKRSLVLFAGRRLSVGPDWKTADIPNRCCCVFSELLDMMANVRLRKMHDKVCATLESNDYLIIRPSAAYHTIYVTVKGYGMLYGYLEMGDIGEIINQHPMSHFEDRYRPQILKYADDGSLRRHRESKYGGMRL